jgi:predicted phage terminase large subunit-like protein
MDNKLQQVEAAKTLLERRLIRRNLARWAQRCGFEPAKHHQLLISKLEAVVRGEIRRLMVIMPPGSAKSTYSSLLFPPWFLAQSPNNRILTASHSIDLAEDWGRKSRNLIKDHSTVLGYTLREDSQAAGHWSTSHGSEYLAAGVGKNIAGFRADLGIIDDPVGSREEAYSETIQKRNYNWFKTDFRTRLKPGAKIVLIQTRWHELDLAGQILRDEADEWTVVNLPLIAGVNDPLGRAKGEMLWPDYFDAQFLKDAQKDPMVFSALYQGDPTPQDGDYFRRDWIENHAYGYNELPNPEELRIYITSDHAISEKEQADFTVMVPFGVDANGTIWILNDIFIDKVNSLAMVNQMISMMKRWKPITWWAEDEKISKSIGPFLRRAMREAGVFCHVEPIKPARDKQTRAQSIRGRMSQGMVRFPRFHKYQEVLTNLLKFPAAAHDDIVDALAYIGLGLDIMGTGYKKPVPRTPTLQSPPITLKWIKQNCRLQQHQKELSLLAN